MKRFIAILLVVQLLLLTSCTIPFFGKSSEQPSGLAEGQKMIELPKNEQLINNGIISDNGTGNTANGITNGAIGSLTGSGIAGADPAATAGAIITPAGVSGAAIASSAILEATDSAIDSTTLPLDQETNETKAVLSAVSAFASNANPGTAYTDNRYPVTVYYQDGDGCLIPMTRWIQMQQGIARAAVSLGIDSAMAREEVAYYGVYPVLPVDTNILGIDIRDNIATIDFDRHLLNYNNAAAERNIIASIVYTLTEFKTISLVRILINGYPQDILKYGTNVSEAIGREDIMINADASLLEKGLDKVDVFLLKKANEGFTFMAPVSIIKMDGIEDTDINANMPEILVKQLLGKNAEGGMNTEMPEGVELLEYSMQNDVLTLNFSESFIDYGGNAREEGILKQLAYTIRQIKGIKSMRILVEGRKIELPEGTDISAGLVIPATINDVMDR